MSKIRLLHLSDFHMCDLQSPLALPIRIRRPKKYLARRFIAEELARWINTNKNLFDAIIVSGDLVDHARPKDLELALSYIETPPDVSNYLYERSDGIVNRSYPTIAGVDKSIFILPGNHDRFSHFSNPAPACDEFDKYFSNYWHAGLRYGIQIELLPSEESPHLAIISSDFCLRSNSDAESFKGRWGQGKIDQSRLDNLVAETVKAKELGIPIVWAVHFAPEFERVQYLDNDCILIDSNILLQAAHDHDVNHILCGHTHVVREYNAVSQNFVKVYCSGTSMCQQEGVWDTSIHIRNIEIYDKQITEITSDQYTWSSDTITFSKYTS